MQFLANTNFPFIKYRRTAYAFSGIIILIGLISLFFHKGPIMGIEFSGGTLIELRYEQTIEIQKIRDALTSIGKATA